VIAFDERNIIVRDAHPASAAAGDGLDHHRIADALGDGQGVLFIFHVPSEPGGVSTPAFFASARLTALSDSAFIAADWVR
jgi:hypothetical protein